MLDMVLVLVYFGNIVKTIVLKLANGGFLASSVLCNKGQRPELDIKYR